jgi:hypothetical protein
MTMKSTRVLEPQSTLEDLSTVTRLIYEAIDVGVQEAKAYFGKRNLEIEPHLAASIVRHEATLYIDKKAPGIDGLQREKKLANCGLHLLYGAYAIKVWKSDEGDIPSPGSSKTKQSYYQQTIAGWAELVGEDESGYVNLIIAWDVSRNYLMMGLTLAYPKDVGDYRSPELHWKLPVPHPADMPRTEFPIGASDTTIGTLSEEDDDLPLTKNPPSTDTDSSDG